MAAAAYYCVCLCWFDKAYGFNPFTEEVVGENRHHTSQHYTRREAWEYVKAVRRHADRNENVRLYDVTVFDCLAGEPVWNWDLEATVTPAH